MFFMFFQGLVGTKVDPKATFVNVFSLWLPMASLLASFGSLWLPLSSLKSPFELPLAPFWLLFGSKS